MSTRTAVITLAHGRHAHLAGQLCGLARQLRQPDVYVAVAMDDAAIADVVDAHAQPQWDVTVVSVPSTPAGLPLAAARNAGARAAIEAGARTLVFLDVDCIPSPTLVQRYAAVLLERRRSPSRGWGPGPVVASGEVGYLPPVPDPRDYSGQDLARLARPHPARPVLGTDEVRVAEDLRLFWSLSFALDADDWQTLGGFCEDYVGYGGEDTDFGQRLGAADGALLWVGSAAAYHQHHPSESPPLQHLDAIVANANRFHRTWGWFPMEGWLERFAQMGLAEVEPRTGAWRVRREAAS